MDPLQEPPRSDDPLTEPPHAAPSQRAPTRWSNPTLRTAQTPPDLALAAAEFATQVGHWRRLRGLTKKQLAARMGFDPSYISHVENGRHRPTEDFASRADATLSADGAIRRRWERYDRLRHPTPGAGVHHRPRSQATERLPARWLPAVTGLVVVEEHAMLSYHDHSYHCLVRRVLANTGDEPVNRYLARIAVDRYPDDPAASQTHHRQHPLTLAELNLNARCGPAGGAEPMRLRAKCDRDSVKEIWLLFENENGRFPLYPAATTTLDYSFQISDHKWGRWFQRAVRLPTRRLRITVDLPAALRPHLWGTETSHSADDHPLRTPPQCHELGGRVRYEWATEQPPLAARYRLAWRFRAEGPGQAHRSPNAS
ncbi:helix-turn-helix transcriptional regulator [Pilimelia columellifera]|uniref:HTH cro/C1-type domain-containing protein n=1 Tax=Pilimelia columellifera subsp. columellifera TaxID=706583 RepID=A0ABN3NRH2_9ACTN